MSPNNAAKSKPFDLQAIQPLLRLETCVPHPDSDRTPDRKEITEHMNKHLLVMAAVWMTPTIALHAQTTPPPLPYQVVNCIKVKPGKGREFRQFWNDVSAKVAQVRADEGRVMTTSLLRSVMPAGEEARCDAMISNFYEGPPPEPSTSARAPHFGSNQPGQ